jgi:hypothetical protein
MRRPWGVVSAISFLVVAWPAPATAAFATALPHASGIPWESPNPSATSNVLYGVTATAPDDAWAVGTYVDDSTGASDTLILRWTGSKWRRVASPNPSATSNVLYGVTATAPYDAWAVGTYVDDSTGASDTLILRWTGSKWRRVASPNPSATSNILYGVTATALDDAWAVGSDETDGTNTLTLHWDGRRWSHVASPGENGYSLASASATSATDAWAVGGDLILRWDGSHWADVAHPIGDPARVGATFASLGGVAALSQTRAWAVGYRVFCHQGRCSPSQTQVLRWNGSTWSSVSSPNRPDAGNVLRAVDADSPSDGWAVGGSCGPGILGCLSASRTLTLRWHGGEWRIVRSPSPGSHDHLYGVNASSTSDAWAVGSFQNGAGVTKTLALNWDGAHWSRT